MAAAITEFRSSHTDLAETTPLAERPDEILVARVQAGDREAFRELVERYQRRLYSVAYGMLRNREDALDVVQDAFIKIHKHIDNFQGSSSFYTWAYRICVNLCIDHIRKRSRHTQVDYDDSFQRSSGEGFDNPIVPSRLDVNPSKVFQRKELMEQLGAAMSDLSEAHRAILLLREVQGLSYTEIAETLDISKGTVMSRLHHARKNLQRSLHEYLDGSLKIE